MSYLSKLTARGAVFGSVSLMALGAGGAVSAAEIDLMFSDVDGKAAIIQDFAERYMKEHPDVTIKMNIVGYDVLREQLPVQLEAGTGPDMAFNTNLGGLHQYYLDLTPYVDQADWEEGYGNVLPWYRAGNEGGIYGFQTELTVTGPYVNLTMFEEAGVEVPGAGATWEEWAEATRQVQDATGSYAGMVMDRSGHRFAGPAMSYGAKYFDDQGHMIVDDGFRTFAQMMVDWHKDGLMPPDIWPAVSGGKYANGNEMFFNQDTPFYMSGSWNIANVESNVGDKFDWAVASVPCGPAGCGVMPGGTGLVGFKDTDAPEAVAGFIAWMGEKEQAAEWYGRTFAIPARKDLQAEGIDYAQYGASQKVSEGLNTFAQMAQKAAEETPQAYELQGDPNNFAMFNATAQYVSAVMNGELTMDEAMEKMKEELAKLY
ncbi:ABC transporter substrate-binding protein [Oceaniglobus roseus]|uniref:ABC transporter substrate-binding protein n=1 Tax=Oceaniglobus roseus TaxID=1737570 RepID=UPI0012FFE521|nr:ABC transporter substrate-binding protein [Kandeliimicrobium roseum]